MKATISINIQDDTSLETMNKMCISSQMLHDMYREAFAGLIRKCAHPAAKWSVMVQITDNTKQEAQDGK